MKKNLLPKHRSQLSRNYYNATYDSQMQNTNSITLAAAAARNLDAAIPLRSADAELLNAIELRTAASQIATICSSKTGSRRQSGKPTISKHFLKSIFLKSLTTSKSRSLEKSWPKRYICGGFMPNLYEPSFYSIAKFLRAEVLYSIARFLRAEVLQHCRISTSQGFIALPNFYAPRFYSIAEF